MPQGPNKPYTTLDQNQIAQRTFDEINDRLRVDAEVTAVIGTVECIISAASGDNIAIADQTGANKLNVNTNGSIDVNVLVLPEIPPININSMIKYGEVASLASGINQTILTYVVPFSTKSLLQSINVSGENIAKYNIIYNSNTIATKRTFYGNLNETFNFEEIFNNSFILNTGDTLKINVIHNRPSLANFETTLQIIEIN